MDMLLLIVGWALWGGALLVGLFCLPAAIMEEDAIIRLLFRAVCIVFLSACAATALLPFSKLWLLALPAAPIVALYLAQFPMRRRARSRARAVIAHLQTQFAYQQLTMELYNDGLDRASASITGGDEITARGQAVISSPALIHEFAIPAAARKVAIFENVILAHNEYEQEGLPEQALAAMSAHSKFLDVALARARLQLGCLREFAAEDEANLSDRITSLDQAEVKKMDAALGSLNELIGQSNMSQDEWFVVCRIAFNEVRELEEGLPPFSQKDYNSLWDRGMSCGRPRFFSDRS